MEQIEQVIKLNLLRVAMLSLQLVLRLDLVQVDNSSGLLNGDSLVGL